MSKVKPISENASRFTTVRLGKDHRILAEMADKSPEEQKKMLFTKDFFYDISGELYRFSVFLFKCFNSCPLGSSDK